jgi:hypothetical protein
MRPMKEIQKFPRTDKLNERYYAENNQPSFPQFGKDYHFYDTNGREYIIADQNRDTFQNKRLRYGPQGKHCISNIYDEVTLYVKLPRGLPWFAPSETGHQLTLLSRTGSESFTVKISSSMKANPKRRTGNIIVAGLGRSLCDRLLNQ